jgi:hypothetical protein
MTAWPGQWDGEWTEADLTWPDDDGGKEGNQAVPAARATAQARTHARIIPAGDPSSFPSAVAGGKAADLIAVALDRPGTLLHARSPTFREAQRRHHECASHHGSVVGSARLAYGYLHMVLVKAPLNYAEWATDSPLRLLIHGMLAALAFAGLLLGGYL